MSCCKSLYSTLEEAAAATAGAPSDVREAVKSATKRVLMGGLPTAEERDLVYAWMTRSQRQDRYGKAVQA
jgi:hypothetical protein